MYLITILQVLLFGVYVNGITNYKYATACERNTLSLNCEENQVLDIVEANYGRTSETICKNGPVDNVECYQEDSLSIVSDLCEGKQNCSIQAENNIFQDPCFGIVKYLYAMYRCVDVIKFKSALACESQSVKLKCGPGKVIKIIEANYGRRSKFICTDGPIRTTYCPNSNSTEVVSDLCKNKRECSVPAANNLFGDPCYGTHKYLTVKYECDTETVINASDTSSFVDPIGNQFHCIQGPSISEDLICDGIHDCPLGEDESDCDYRTKYACEGDTLKIKCAKNEKILIRNSNYGRLSKYLCPGDNMHIKKTDCKESHSINVLKKKCNGNSKCDTKVENKVFRDPCEGTYKYLQVHYDCVSDDKYAHKINPRSL